MNEVLRKVRGLFGLGLTWGALWAVIGGVIGVLVGFVTDAWLWYNPILEWGLGMGLYGFVSGVGFGKLLAFAEHRKRLEELSLPRVALWGVLGSAMVPVVFGALGLFAPSTGWVDVVTAMGVTAFLGGVSAPGFVALARRAELTEGARPELLES